MRWESTFGSIETEEQLYFLPKEKKIFRPFLFSSRLENRSYSLPLQRRITDFGSDVSFKEVNKKLQEHYGIEVPESSIRVITLQHGDKMKKLRDEELGFKEKEISTSYIISETDGSMIPIVEPSKDENVTDKRKNKKLFYREARLTMARPIGMIKGFFSAILGNVEESGKHILYCVKKIGFNAQTKIHCVGDGASWIASQVAEKLGSQSTYLIDFFHVCEYLADAAGFCCRGKPKKDWMKTQKDLLKDNQALQVCETLYPFIESEETPDIEAPVRRCHRYIKNRLHQLDYKTAIENNLPIGSGEIESGHRYVIQKRLKIPGAWWLDENAHKMLALRSLRVNDNWDEYWRKHAS